MLLCHINLENSNIKTMKKFILIITFFFGIIGFVSCTEDNDLIRALGGQIPENSNGNSGNSNGNSGNSGGSGNSGNNGSSTTYEKPDIGLEDYTCYRTSITLKYRIYNQNEAKVTSARGYYGTSSPTSSVGATVAGSLITIHVSGLKAGTKYYFKCSATGPGGTSTSGTTGLMTDG